MPTDPATALADAPSVTTQPPAQTPPPALPAVPTSHAPTLESLTPYAYLVFACGYVVALVGVIVLAAIHDGALASVAMQIFQNVILGSVGGASLWGTAHTITSAVARKTD